VSADEMLFVTAGVAAPTAIDSKRTAAAQVGMPFQYRIVASGGTSPLLFNAAPLPDGWTVDAASGVIAGVPAAAGVVSMKMSASNSAGVVAAGLSITVAE
jgi:hypothetical protein